MIPDEPPEVTVTDQGEWEPGCKVFLIVENGNRYSVKLTALGAPWRIARWRTGKGQAWVNVWPDGVTGERILGHLAAAAGRGKDA